MGGNQRGHCKQNATLSKMHMVDPHTCPLLYLNTHFSFLSYTCMSYLVFFCITQHMLCQFNLMQEVSVVVSAIQIGVETILIAVLCYMAMHMHIYLTRSSKVQVYNYMCSFYYVTKPLSPELHRPCKGRGLGLGLTQHT